jgi:hypothetical protein
MQHRAEPSPAAVLISVAVLALVLTVALGPLGFVIGLALFVLMFAGTRNKSTVELVVPMRTRSRIRRLSTAGRIAIVGEAHYQDAITEVARNNSAPGSGTDRPDTGIAATAVLVPESADRYDDHAVRVDLLRGDGSAVIAGYLRNDHAATYQPLLLQLAERGEVGSCPARIIGQRYLTVHLHLGDARLLLLDHEALGTAPTLPAEQQVGITEEEAHQHVLHRVVNGRTPVHVIAELRDCRIAKGPHTGERTLEVLLEGERVGQLTYAMGVRYCDMVQEWRVHTGRALCEAVIINEGTRGLHAKLLLPK